MSPAWASTRYFFRVRCTAWRRICTRHLSQLRAQVPADPVSAAVVEAVEVFLAAALVAVAGARSKRKGPARERDPSIEFRDSYFSPPEKLLPQRALLPHNALIPQSALLPQR